MRDFLLGITLLGIIIWSSSFTTEDDKKLYESYCQKKNQGDTPTGGEAFVYWVYQLVALGKPLTALGILGLVIYYIF